MQRAPRTLHDQFRGTISTGVSRLRRSLNNLATGAVTTSVAKLLSEAPIWVVWQKWLQGDLDPDAKDAGQAQGLATMERLARLMNVDEQKTYTLTSFIEAIVAAGAKHRALLPMPTGPISRTYLVTNPDVVLTSVLYLLSKSAKASIIY